MADEKKSADEVKLTGELDGSPRDTMPSPTGVAVDEAVLKAAALQSAGEISADKEVSAMAFQETQVVDLNAIKPDGPDPDAFDDTPMTMVEPSLALTVDAVAPLDEAEEETGDESTQIASYQQIAAAHNLQTFVTPPSAAPQKEPLFKESREDVKPRLADSTELFEEDSESTVYTPYDKQLAGLPPLPNKGGAAKAKPVEETSTSSESTSFDDPDIKFLRDKVMKQIQDERKADRAQKIEAAVAKSDEHISTIVDTQLSEEDLKRIHGAAKDYSENALRSTVALSSGRNGGSSEHRSCMCEEQQTQAALRALSEVPGTNGHWLFALLAFLIVMGGTTAVLAFGMTRLGQFQGIAGLVFFGLGFGVVIGSCLSVRTTDGQQSKLLLYSFAFALLSAGCLMASALSPGLNVFQVQPHGLVKLQPWGVPFVREGVLWFLCFFAGTIGGWSFRLSSESHALIANIPDYAAILGEFHDPDLERAGRSYNDILMRSRESLSLVSATGAKGTTCSYCFRDGKTLAEESQGREWEKWFLSCPHCSEHLCVQHFAENAWQCRSCGKAIRTSIKRCADCAPGHLPEGQRAMLCPHCHQWKGCLDHYKARGWECPVCSQDVKSYAQAYGRL